MELSLDSANIVILAKNHNPTIVSKEWLTQKEILTGEIVSFVHTPAFSVTETDIFTFIVDPERLQISIKENISENIEILSKIAKAYITKLPETPYTAIGFNYLYNIATERKSLKNILSPNDEKFKNLFSEDYQLGGSIRFKFENFLVIINFRSENDGKIVADFNFNFNSEDVGKIIEKIETHATIKRKSEEILEELFND
jgi:hypothetical protein